MRMLMRIWEWGSIMLDAEFYRRQCARLREENEELVDEVKSLRAERDAYAYQCDSPQVRVARRLEVTPAAARVLCRLLDSAPRVVSRDCLLAHLDSPRGSDELVKVYITRLRKAFEHRSMALSILNVWGQGYRITVEDADAMRIFLSVPKSENDEDHVNELLTFDGKNLPNKTRFG